MYGCSYEGFGQTLLVKAVSMSSGKSVFYCHCLKAGSFFITMCIMDIVVNKFSNSFEFILVQNQPLFGIASHLLLFT